MDIKKIIDELVEKIKNDKDIASKFTKDPIKTVEELCGIDLPDEKIKDIVDAIKVKLNLSGLSDKLENLADSDIAGKLGNLFK